MTDNVKLFHCLSPCVTHTQSQTAHCDCWAVIGHTGSIWPSYAGSSMVTAQKVVWYELQIKLKKKKKYEVQVQNLTSFPYIIRWCVVMSALKTTTQLLLVVLSNSVSASWGTFTFISLVQWIKSENTHDAHVKATHITDSHLKWF